MAELFSGLPDFKQYVGGSINTSLQIESLEPIIWQTARRWVVPCLGQSFYDSLVAASAPNAAQAALLPYVKRALAWLTLWEYTSVGNVEFGESGMHRIESETRKAAYRYQEKAYQEKCRDNGFNALESMLLWLDDHASDHPTWVSTDEAQAHLSLLLNYAKDFRVLNQAECTRYTYETMRPIIREVEYWAAEQLLPAAFWSGFITRHINDTLTAKEKVLRTMMRTAICHLSIEQAMQRHWVKVEGGRVFVVEEFGEQSATNRTMPINSGANLSTASRVWGDANTNRWKAYITANVADFATVFDVASGGSNAAADAWHINTSTEQEEVDCATADYNRTAGVVVF